ncbi:MAG: methylated-DNA--[protein]-cysteine S-methyltransferase [bacterium]|nr:methylated-DNA--[protein]-cysteine S-methyltransferase [bacterium]
MPADNFFAEVYRIVVLILFGTVATYGQIAFLIGKPRGARTVGWAMRLAPPHLCLPWHRVVHKEGGLCLALLDEQRDLLVAEGICFRDDGKVDMEKQLWRT